MTEQTEAPAEAPVAEATPQDQATQQEPEPSVSLKEAVEEGIKAAPKKAAEITQQLSQQLSPEQLKQVEALAESKASRAVNEALSAEREKAKSIQSLTQDDVKSQVDEAIKLERQVSEAQRQLDITLGQLGAPVGSEAYAKVEAIIAEGLQSGAISHQALFNEILIKGFVAAAGVGTQEESSQVNPGVGTHGSAISTDKEGVRLSNVRNKMEQAMAEALRKG
jgi:hypothetical protein